MGSSGTIPSGRPVGGLQEPKTNSQQHFVTFCEFFASEALGKGPILFSGNIRNITSTSFPAKRTLTYVWQKLWPVSVVECDIEESERVPCRANNQRGCVFGQDLGTGGG
ncbi:hypothetical protein AVEN_193641-1 [Araneus ventricosus]|uniref:Uncharacterized protein n=1 Tax=Araneus ventricosus TaxID=182803 RepID=A0A4Y2HEX0_ARAVE|nr:hypothetical protein AVEN_193641-1 [Araneus ventricosus]